MYRRRIYCESFLEFASEAVPELFIGEIKFQPTGIDLSE